MLATRPVVRFPGECDATLLWTDWCKFREMRRHLRTAIDVINRPAVGDERRHRSYQVGPEADRGR
jgi:hypothetical protein